MKDPYKNPKSLDYRLRQKRFQYVEEIISSILKKRGNCKILDIGGSEQYWDIGREFIKNRNVTIDIVNLTKFDTTENKFRSLVGDAKYMPEFENNSYDLCHANSVLEHVGTWTDMVSMAKEISRLSTNYFVQVPYFWFPFEPHFRTPFYHWLPEQIRYRLLMKKSLGYHTRQNNIGDAMIKVQSAQLLDYSQLISLFPDAKIIPEKIGFMTKSLMAVRTE